MAVRVNLPGVLAKLTEGKVSLEAVGATVGEVVSDLVTRYPELEARLRDSSGEPYEFISIYLNDQDIRFVDGFASALDDGDEITVVPAVAGG